MKEDGIRPGKISFNSMINVYASSGLHDGAEIIFQEMQESSRFPNSLMYLALTRAYTEGKCYSKAEEAIHMMLKSNIAPSCPHFNHLIFAFLKEGQIDAAIEALRVSYKKMKPFCVTFATTNMGSAILAMGLVRHVLPFHSFAT